MRGELTVTQGARRLSWGAFALSSTAARETLRKKLEGLQPGPEWGRYLEEVAYKLTRAVREGEPLVVLTGRNATPARELLPRLLYEGEPTQIFADCATGKSLTATAIAVAMASGAALPFGLKPDEPVPVAYLDWETSRETVEARAAQLAAGLGVPVTPIVYKHMRRPLVDEVGALAPEFARRGVRVVVIDSKMFALACGEGAAFHEPMTALYNALRLFGRVAPLVLRRAPGSPRGGDRAGRPRRVRAAVARAPARRRRPGCPAPARAQREGLTCRASFAA